MTNNTHGGSSFDEGWGFEIEQKKGKRTTKEAI